MNSQNDYYYYYYTIYLFFIFHGEGRNLITN